MHCIKATAGWGLAACPMSPPLGEFGGKSLLKDAMGFDLGDRGWWTQAEGWIKGGLGKEWAEGGLDRESERLADWDLRFKRKKQLGFLNSSLVILAKTGLYHQELKSSLIKALFKSYPHPLRLNHLDLRHHLGPRAHFLTDPTRIFNHYKSITVGSIQQ